MKIKVVSPQLKVPILLSFPLSFLRSVFLYKIIRKGSDADQKEYLYKLLPSIREVTAVLEDFVRCNGHFILAEVKEKDGTYVRIRI